MLELLLFIAATCRRDEFNSEQYSGEERGTTGAPLAPIRYQSRGNIVNRLAISTGADRLYSRSRKDASILREVEEMDEKHEKNRDCWRAINYWTDITVAITARLIGRKRGFSVCRCSRERAISRSRSFLGNNKCAETRADIVESVPV